MFKNHSFTHPCKHPCIYWHHFHIIHTKFIIICGTFCSTELKTFEVAACLCIIQGVSGSTRRFSTYWILKSCLTARDMYSMPLHCKFSRSLTSGRDFHLWPTATNNMELRWPPRFLWRKFLVSLFTFINESGVICYYMSTLSCVDRLIHLIDSYFLSFQSVAHLDPLLCLKFGGKQCHTNGYMQRVWRETCGCNCMNSWWKN